MNPDDPLDLPSSNDFRDPPTGPQRGVETQPPDVDDADLTFGSLANSDGRSGTAGLPKQAAAASDVWLFRDQAQDGEEFFGSNPSTQLVRASEGSGDGATPVSSGVSKIEASRGSDPLADKSLFFGQTLAEYSGIGVQVHGPMAATLGPNAKGTSLPELATESETNSQTLGTGAEKSVVVEADEIPNARPLGEEHTHREASSGITGPVPAQAGFAAENSVAGGLPGAGASTAGFDELPVDAPWVDLPIRSDGRIEAGAVEGPSEGEGGQTGSAPPNQEPPPGASGPEPNVPAGWNSPPAGGAPVPIPGWGYVPPGSGFNGGEIIDNQPLPVDPGALGDSDVAINQISEGVAAGEAVGITVTASVEANPGRPHSYSVSDPRFNIDAAGVIRLVPGAVFDAESEPLVSVQVLVTSADGVSSTQTFSIAVADLNEFNVTAPADVNSAANALLENAVAGTDTGIRVQAADADATTNAVSYRVDDARFTVDADGTVRVATGASFDRETEASINLNVTASSADGSAASTRFILAVGDVDEFNVTAPTDVNSAANTLLENAVAGTDTGIRVQAADADATTNAVSYSVDDGRFTVETDGTLRIANGASFDAETESAITLRVTATSADGSSTSSEFLLAVGDVNEHSVSAPVDLSNTVSSLSEDAISGTRLDLRVQAIDADASNNQVSYSISDTRFTIAADGSVRVAAGAQFDYESEPEVIFDITATSADGSSSTSAFMVDIVDVDEFDVTAPVDTNAATNGLAENAGAGSLVGIRVQATDADASSNIISYSVDDHRFTVATDGTVRVASGASFDAETEASINLNITASSADGSSSSSRFTLAVGDINEHGVSLPTDRDAGQNIVREHAREGSAVGIRLQASDADASNNQVSFSVSDDRFTVDTDGTVRIAANADFDASIESSISLTVTATSADGSTASQNFGIAVATPTLRLVVDNDFAVFTGGDGNVSRLTYQNNVRWDQQISSGPNIDIQMADGESYVYVVAMGGGYDENIGGLLNGVDITTISGFEVSSVNIRPYLQGANGTNIEDGSYQVNLADVQAGLIGANWSAVTTDSTSSGVGSTLTGRAWNFQSEGTSVFRFRLADSETSDAFDVTAPIDRNAASNVIAENASAGTAVGIQVSATDADAGSNISYTVSDNRFTVDADGTVRVATGASFNFEAETTINLNISASSSDGSTASTSFTLMVSDAAEDLVLTSGPDTYTESGVSESSVRASGGNDTLSGGVGNDTFYGQIGDDLLIGNDGNDSLYGEEGNDQLVGGSGNDRLDGGEGNDQLYAGSGDDEVHGGAGSDFITGDEGNDQLFGGAGSDTLYGNDGADTLDGGSDNDHLDGMSGDDRIIAGLGNDHLQGNGGFDTVAFTGQANEYTFTRQSATVFDVRDSIGARDGQDHMRNVEQVEFAGVSYRFLAQQTTSGFAENAVGGTAVGNAFSLVGGDGAALSVNDSRFTIDASGIIRLVSGASFDAESESSITLTISRNDGVSGTRSLDFTINDVNEFSVTAPVDVNASTNSVMENAAAGIDTGIRVYASDDDASNSSITYSLSDNRFTVDADGTVRVASGAVIDYEASPSISLNITATSSDGSTASQSFTISVQNDPNDDFGSQPITTNTVNGNNSANQLFGTAGNDHFNAGGGDDQVYARSGDDVAYGGDGRDQLYGEAGNDWLHGEGDRDRLYGHDGDDRLFGGADDDELYGDAGHDFLDGGSGRDRLYGGSGNDTFLGGAGARDELYGESGDDIFIFRTGDGMDSAFGGGGGQDVLSLQNALGGAVEGGWTYQLSAGSVVSQGEDHLALSSDANGYVQLGDGSRLDFAEMERITW